MPFGDVVLQTFDAWLLKLDNHSACGADQMVVVCFEVGDFVTRKAIPKVMFGRDAAFHQELECAVHGGVAHLRIFAAHLTQKLFYRLMASRFEKNLRDQSALTRRAQPFVRHVLIETFVQGLVLFFRVQHVGRQGALMGA